MFLGGEVVTSDPKNASAVIPDRRHGFRVLGDSAQLKTSQQIPTSSQGPNAGTREVEEDDGLLLWQPRISRRFIVLAPSRAAVYRSRMGAGRTDSPTRGNGFRTPPLVGPFW